MTTITAAPAATPLARRAPARPSRPAAWATLARRRISLSAHTPREILAPLATPLLFALVIAPALAKIIQAAGGGGADYSTFVIVGTVGLLIPLTCTFAGIGVIVDRTTGARRELLTAPIPPPRSCPATWPSPSASARSKSAPRLPPAGPPAAPSTP